MKNLKSRSDFGRVSVVENLQGEYAVIGQNDEIIVPFGRYEWIDGFECGLARVRTSGIDCENLVAIITGSQPSQIYSGEYLAEYLKERKQHHPEEFVRWGIINSHGEEVLKVEFDSVSKFLGKGYKSVFVKKDGKRHRVFFQDLPGSDVYFEGRYFSRLMRERSHYEEYTGSYVQEVAGYSDEIISDAFEGDPDAYWNID